MRLPNVIKISSLNNSKKSKKRDKGSLDERTRDVSSSSTVSNNSSTKEAPISPTKTGKVTFADTDTAREEMKGKGDSTKVDINPYEFFESDTWRRNPGQNELQLVINEKAIVPPQKPRDWLADVKISTDNGISGVSSEPIASSSKYYYNSDLSSLSYTSSKLTRAMSLDTSESNTPAGNITVKQPQRRHTSGDLNKNVSESTEDQPTTTGDAEARRRRRRTYHVTHLQANPFFHATFKKSKIQDQT